MFLFLIYIVYLALWFLLVFVSCLIAWRFSKSKKITVIAGMVAFLVMFWPAFGDFIPTYLAHKKMCEKEAGFKIYVTPEQWAENNPGVLETLVPYRFHVEKDGVVLGNERIGSISAWYPYPEPNVRKEVSKTIDIKSNLILAERVDFRRGYINYSSDDIDAVKIWLFLPYCFSKSEVTKINSEMIEFNKKLNIKWSN